MHRLFVTNLACRRLTRLQRNDNIIGLTNSRAAAVITRLQPSHVQILTDWSRGLDSLYMPASQSTPIRAFFFFLQKKKQWTVFVLGEMLGTHIQVWAPAANRKQEQHVVKRFSNYIHYLQAFWWAWLSWTGSFTCDTFYTVFRKWHVQDESFQCPLSGCEKQRSGEWSITKHDCLTWNFRLSQVFPRFFLRFNWNLEFFVAISVLKLLSNSVNLKKTDNIGTIIGK